MLWNCFLFWLVSFDSEHHTCNPPLVTSQTFSHIKCGRLTMVMVPSHSEVWRRQALASITVSFNIVFSYSHSLELEVILFQFFQNWCEHLKAEGNNRYFESRKQYVVTLLFSPNYSNTVEPFVCSKIKQAAQRFRFRCREAMGEVLWMLIDGDDEMDKAMNY